MNNILIYIYVYIVEPSDTSDKRKSRANRRTSAVSTLEEDYSTSDEISGKC